MQVSKQVSKQRTDNHYDKPVGDWTLHLAQMSLTHRQPMTDSMTDMQILGSKYWALGGLNQKSKKKLCRVRHGVMTAKKWLDSIEKQKKEESV